MEATNSIQQRRNADGSLDFIVNLGNILYNNRVVALRNLKIPLSKQQFFVLPEDKDKYAIVNVYYSVDSGRFLFDLLQKTATFITNSDANAIPNALPIAQFVLRQKLSSFEVLKINEYSKMATFTITDTYTEGLRGLQGPVGETGALGILDFKETRVL